MDNKVKALGKRSQQAAQLTQSAILDQAEHLFAKKGFGGVSMRDIAQASGVQHHTISHHFGNKANLYQTVIRRWDHAVEDQISQALKDVMTLEEAVHSSIDTLFDFLLTKRDWITLTARTAMGEEQPEGVTLQEHHWIQFMMSSLNHSSEKKLAMDSKELGLLLMSIEGLLNAHVLGKQHYEQLFGKDVTDKSLRNRTKQHLKTMIVAMINESPLANSLNSPVN